MKIRSILVLAGAMSLLGAGCMSSSSPQTPPTVTPPVSNPPTSTPVAPPDTSASTTSSTSSKPPVVKTYAFPGVLDASELKKKVLIKTTMGDIEIQIDPAAGPNAASNFVYLVQQGFYDGTIFHRVIPGFMIQGGDPTGTGTGGPGYKFKDDPVTGKYTKGIVAMANAGPNTNGSQFFIMVGDVGLPPSYSIFGHVISGQDVADKISQVDRQAPGQLDRPFQEIKMLSVTIE